MVVGPLIGPIATGTGRLGVAAAVRRFRKKIPAGLGATIKWVVTHADELEEAGLCPWCGTEGAHVTPRANGRTSTSAVRSVRPKRKASAQQKKYGREFKKICSQYKKKNGQWKKNGFARCVRAAHKRCK